MGGYLGLLALSAPGTVNHPVLQPVIGGGLQAQAPGARLVPIAGNQGASQDPGTAKSMSCPPSRAEACVVDRPARSNCRKSGRAVTGRS